MPHLGVSEMCLHKPQHDIAEVNTAAPNRHAERRVVAGALRNNKLTHLRHGDNAHVKC